MSAQRVVSLIASATEIVCALGCESRLVGRSHECDYPLAVKKLPACTEPKFDTDGTSYEIDQHVKGILEKALSVYRVNAEKLKRLRPDVIVTQSQCEVCAVSLKDVEQAVCEWLDSRPRIVSLEPNSLGDVWADIGRVAQALGLPDKGMDLVRRLEKRASVIAARTHAMRSRPTVACLEWIEPLMATGNWMPELVEMAGGRNLFGNAGRHSPWMTWEQLQEKDPDVIIVLPCGFDIQRTRRDMPALTVHAGWSKLNAVRNRRVYVADGNQYFNRPGPRLVESLEILAEILHPGIFRFGHEKNGWERY
jgi:iron complex transport system substrate-binding protein